MEILMKLKCSPTPAHSSHFLKSVDRLQQQPQQQSSSPLQQFQYQTKKQQQQQQQQQQNDTTYQQRLNCMDYNTNTNTRTTANINCCSTLNQSDYMSMSGRCCTAGSCCSPQIPACCTSGLSRNLIFNPQMNLNNNNSNSNSNSNMNSNGINEDYNFEENKFEYKEPEENFVSIDDIKIKGFLMKIGQEQKRKKEAEQQKTENKEKEANKFNNNNNNNKKPAIVYEIIDLDDEEEREKLKRIKNQAEAAAATTKSNIQSNQLKNVNEEIMQQVQQQRLQMQQLSRHSPNISLVPAQSKKTNYKQRREKQQQQQEKVRIIAQIELLDSSDEEATAEDYDDEVEPAQDEGDHVFQVMSDDEGNDALVPAVLHNEDNEDDDDEDDEDIPLAAAAVSCELECDENDDFDQQQQQQQKSKLNQNKQRNANGVLGSDDDNDDYVDEHEEGLIVRWDELELEQEQRNCNLTARNIFECFICGKRVQSNYNLRRHMMIHTGERPFGCDLCERRFREFSDLKKHRRRHAGDSNFMCMVCRIKPPSDGDPTRCDTCDPKMGAVIALRQTNSEGASKASKIVSTALQAQRKLLPPLTKMATITKIATPPPPPEATIATTTTTTTKTKTIKLNNPSKSAESLNESHSIQAIKTEQLPPLTPIRSSFEEQLVMLDTIPAVHRSVYTKGVGLVRRKEFPCPICQRPFGTRHNLKRHFMIHTGEKPFSCTRCRKPFREYSTLKKHMITHARERWYKCLRCPDKFLDYLDYMKHKFSHSEETTGSGADDASASSSASASAHNSPQKRARQSSYRHDDSADSQDEDSSVAEDCLECCECGQRFTDLDSYTEHIKAHEAHTMFYECFVCKQSLSDLSSFEKHMKDAHDAVVQSENEDDEDCEMLIDNEPKLLIMPINGNKNK